MKVTETNVQQEHSIPSNIPSDSSESSQSEFQSDQPNLNVINLQNAVLPKTEILDDGCTKIEYAYNRSGELCRIKRKGEDGIERDPSNTSSVEFKPTPIPQSYTDEEKQNDAHLQCHSQLLMINDWKLKIDD